jgi:protein-glutamine gamma-glutamyltransferase
MSGAFRALPHPLAPAQRAAAPREMGWLVVSLALVVAPHLLRAPWWLIAFTLCLYAWRVHFMLSRGPLPSRWLILAIALVGIIGVWADQRTLFGRNAGVMLLLLFSGLKLMEVRSHRDAAIAVFLGYFLIVTNLLFTQSIPTALAMCVALGMLTASLVGLSAPQRPLAANLRTTGLLLGHAAPAAIALFLLFPRVQGPLWGLPQDAHAGLSGLSGSMTPGNISRLVLSDATAFRAQFRGEPPPHRELYWRGPVLWDFDGRTWHMGAQYLAHYEPPTGGGPTYEYELVLEPHNREWLFALESAATAPERARFTPDGQLMAPTPIRSRIRYDMTSIVVGQLRPDESRTMLDRALRLPRDGNPRARTLAQSWRRDARSDSEVLARAMEYMRAGAFTYSLEPPLLGADAVDDFLFSTREGFCEHFSSAFVFLMRAAGVPARVVMGYLGGDVNSYDRIITVRQSEAHAWAEVFLEGRGWVRVDPTAATNPVRIDAGLARSVSNAGSLPFLLRADLEWLRQLRHRWEAVAHKWNIWVLGYTPERQRDLLSFIGIPDADWRALTATLFTILGILTAGLLAWSLRRLTRPDPVQRAWTAFCRKLAEHGVARAAHEGPRDYASRAARALPASRRSILRIGALYIRLRYGVKPGHAAASVAELRRLVRELRLT